MNILTQLMLEGRTMTRSEIYAKCFGVVEEDSNAHRTIDVHVARINSKIGSAKIRGVKNEGYAISGYQVADLDRVRNEIGAMDRSGAVFSESVAVK